MGESFSKQKLIDAIVSNNEGELSKILQDNPKLATWENKNLITILLKHGADINMKCGGKGNTGLMWAAWRNNLPIVKYLIENNADVYQTNHQGENALDISIYRMSYHTALFLKQFGLEPKDNSFYSCKLAIDFDLDYFLECLNKETEVTNYSVFLIKSEDNKNNDDKESLYMDTLHNDIKCSPQGYIFINNEDNNDPSCGMFISDKDFDELSNLEGKFISYPQFNSQPEDSSGQNEAENSIDVPSKPIW